MLINAQLWFLEKAKHASGEGHTWGIDGTQGTIVDMKEYNVWETYAVKVQTLKTAIEVFLIYP